MWCKYFPVESKTEPKKAKELKRSVGVITVEFTRETRPSTIQTVLDPGTHEQVSVAVAIDNGFFDANTNEYVNTLSGALQFVPVRRSQEHRV